MKNVVIILKNIVLQFVITAFYLFFIGVTPSATQSTFIVICFFGALIYLIIESLNSGDVFSLFFGIAIVCLLAISIFLICLNIVLYKTVQHMIVSLFIFFTLLIFLVIVKRLIKVSVYKKIYNGSLIIIGALGIIFLFSAYFYPDEFSYRNFHNTIVHWGRMTEYSGPDDAVYFIQFIIAIIFFIPFKNMVSEIVKKILK